MTLHSFLGDEDASYMYYKMSDSWSQIMQESLLLSLGL